MTGPSPMDRSAPALATGLAVNCGTHGPGGSRGGSVGAQGGGGAATIFNWKPC